jgi:N-acetylglutamate synthase-like GNAT family acetyltransferase
VANGGLYVAPEARTLGVGTRLVEAVETEAGRLGFGRLYLFTFDKAAYYARRGWTELERPCREEEARSELAMRGQ